MRPSGSSITSGRVSSTPAPSSHVRDPPVVERDQYLGQRRQDQHAGADRRVGQRHDRADAGGEPAAEQGGGHDHAERGGAKPAEQPDRQKIMPQLGREAGEQIAEAEARKAEAVGDARAEAIDQLAGERPGEPVGQHVDGIGERDVGARDAEALLHRQQEHRECLGHAAGEEVHGKGEDDERDEERALGLVLGLCHLAPARCRLCGSDAPELGHRLAEGEALARARRRPARRPGCSSRPARRPWPHARRGCTPRPSRRRR